MSEEVKIDENYLANIADEAQKLAEFIRSEGEIVNDKKADIFHRYMAHHKLKAIFEAVKMTLDITRASFCFGHDMHHSFLNTEEAKENEWGIVKLDQNPFFTTEEQEKHRKFKRMIGSAIFGALKEVVQESNKETPATH
jgi:hypothetical protein